MDFYTKVPKPPSLGEVRRRRKSPDVNLEQGKHLSLLDKLALFLTERVGTMGFFLIILSWTVLWTGYNLLATDVRGLHWTPFDEAPAFVAYLLISNVIQILLMPLIIVGQNLQGRHAEKRAESDFEVNVKAEQEIEVIVRHLEYQNAILITMLEKLGVSPEEAIAVINKARNAAPRGLRVFMMNRSRDPITTSALLVLAASAPVRRLRMDDWGHHPVTASERSRMS